MEGTVGELGCQLEFPLFFELFLSAFLKFHLLCVHVDRCRLGPLGKNLRSFRYHRLPMSPWRTLKEG